MRVTVLAENTACRGGLTAEHGLSLYIEANDLRILFDAGQTGAFAENAEKLGVDLTAVDLAVLSHGHYDHGGGIARFLQCNGHAPVYVNRNAFASHYHGPEKYIGLDAGLLDSGRLVFTDDACQIAPGVTLLTCNDRPRPYGGSSNGLTVVRNGVRLPDDFSHEQYLLIESEGKRYVFTGCAHKGILNIAHWLQPDVLVGGFHLHDASPERLAETARILAQHPTVCCTGHCTGQGAYDFLKNHLGNRLHHLSTGKIFDL